MPQGSSAVRPTNGLYTLPFSRVNLSVPTSRETDMLPAVQKSPQEATILRCVKSENDADLLTKWYNFIDTALLYWILFKIFKYLQYFTIWIIKCVTPFFVVLNTIMFWDYGVLGCDAVFIGNFKNMSLQLASFWTQQRRIKFSHLLIKFFCCPWLFFRIFRVFPWIRVGFRK